MEQAKKVNYWIIAFILIYTTFNGAIRKWILSSAVVDGITFLVQLTFLFIFLASYRRSLTGDGRIIVGLYGLALIFFALNPLNATILHGIVGFMLHFGLWLTCFIYLQNRDVFQFERLIRLAIIILSIEFLLGIIQYNLPNNHILNKYIDDEAGANAFVGDRVRISGTFSYISGFTAFLSFCGFFLWALSIRRTNILIRYVLTFFSLLAVLMSGSRSALIIFAMPVAASIIEDLLEARTRAVGIVTFVIAIGFFPLLYNNIELVAVAVDNYALRVSNGMEGDQDRRVFGPLEEVINFRGDQPVFGIGLGATYAGVNSVLGKSYYVLEYGYYEEIAERILVEGGFVLFFIRILMFGLLYWYSYLPKLYLLPFLIIVTFYFNLCFNVPQIIYFITGFCMVDKAYYLRRQQDLGFT